MPTLTKIGANRVMIRTNDHPPPHVHIVGPEAEAIFFLNCPAGPVKLRESYNFSQKELQEFEDILNQGIPTMCNKWGEIHGNS